MWRAELGTLCGRRAKKKSVKIVNECTEDGEVLETALNDVLAALKPWPALKIADWFWETKSGRKVAWAQWKLYGKDSLTPSQTARLMWGDNRNTYLKRVQWYLQSGKLHYYFDPHTIGKPKSRVYLRRSEVLKFIEAGGHITKKKPTKKKKEANESTTTDDTNSNA